MSNEDRRMRASRALAEYREVASGEDHEDQVTDFLTDLMHYVGTGDDTLNQLLGRAFRHYEAEVEEEANIKVGE